MVLDRLDHDGVLAFRYGHLHPACSPYRVVRDVAVARDLVGGINHYHALADLIGQYARALAQDRGLADARRADEQNASARFHQVFYNGNRAIDRAAYTACEANNVAPAIAYARYTVEGTLDTCAVVA